MDKKCNNMHENWNRFKSTYELRKLGLIKKKAA